MHTKPSIPSTFRSEQAPTIAAQANRALYKQLADLIREQIRNGVLRPGAFLPGEQKLTRQHRLGRETVRQAIAVLRTEGLVDSRRGLGTHVRLPIQRTAVALDRGDRAIVRMPAEPERCRYTINEGVPIIEIHRADGTTQMHPGDSVELIPRP